MVDVLILSRVQDHQCMFCAHLDFSPYDPGHFPCDQYPMILKCRQKHWDSQDAYSLDDLRRMLLRAYECPNWTPADLDELRLHLPTGE
jgi:hypothetical protein